MENNIECECGKVHLIETKNITVSKDAFEQLLSTLKDLKDINNIAVFNSIEDCFYVKKLCEFLKDKKINITVVNMPNCLASISEVQNIESNNYDYIVAIGSEQIISVAKYYSYMYDIKLVIFPIGNFTDWTFSKFARLYDGVTCDFYLTNEPLYIYVSSQINQYNSLQTNYIASKYIALFDCVVRENVYRVNICPRAKDFLKQTLNGYISAGTDKNKSNLKNIWTLIRLGQGMSFYSETKLFFGGDKAIVDILQAQIKSSDFLEMETIALKLIMNLYSCFYKKYPSRYDVNLNKHIKLLSTLINVSQVMVIKRLTDSNLILGNDSIYSRFSNYFHYIKKVFDNCKSKIYKIQSTVIIDINIIKKFKLSHKRIEQSFALASSFCYTPCSLHLFSAFGYLDKLL